MHLSAFGQASLAPDRAEFVIGNGYFVLLHEFAHVIIHDFAVPVLGNEEDAADTLAATTLIRLDQLSPSGDFRYTKMLLMAADANRILWQRGFERENPEAAYWANHPLSVQRAARIACLALGSDTEVFAALPELLDMPLFRADWCEDEYALADSARAWVRSTYGVDGQPDAAGAEPDIQYATPRAPSHEPLLALIKDEQMLERTAEFVTGHFLLPEDLSINARSCGSPDAYWDGNAREVVLCYELLEAFYKLSAEQKVQALERRLREMHASGG